VDDSSSNAESSAGSIARMSARRLGDTSNEKTVLQFGSIENAAIRRFDRRHLEGRNSIRRVEPSGIEGPSRLCDRLSERSRNGRKKTYRFR
jgi:hypothetical protein